MKNDRSGRTEKREPALQRPREPYSRLKNNQHTSHKAEMSLVCSRNGKGSVAELVKERWDKIGYRSGFLGCNGKPLDGFDKSDMLD